MMDLESAIQHCKEQVQEQAKKGCYSCAEEHQQLAEWLKELKAYREQRGAGMNVEEKERLIKKDIVSIENRVRHAFNQGYEMGLKESRSKIPNTCGDAISRQIACPFCGAEAHMWSWNYGTAIQCSKFDSHTHVIQVSGQTSAEAIERWNAREAEGSEE